MTDKYKILRDKVARISEQIIGKSAEQAAEICKGEGLPYRWVRKDGEGMMITADCKMDRIGFVIEKGVVTGTENG
jgi:hypothetical protein